MSDTRQLTLQRIARSRSSSSRVECTGVICCVGLPLLLVLAVHHHGSTQQPGPLLITTRVKPLRPIDQISAVTAPSDAPLVVLHDATDAAPPTQLARPVNHDPSRSFAPPASLVVQPLPSCSVVFFHHLEKTAGTTLRAIFQRHAQLGMFDFFSFVNRYNKIQFQAVTHRLDELMRTPGGLTDLRLAVEIHVGGGGYEQFLKYTLPDLLLLRTKLRGAGCRCNLVTLLRHPLMAHLSWHHHFVSQRVPLCFWANPFDCQSRMSMALACHGGPSIRPLTGSHQRAIQLMWDSFDLVGVTEHFDEFVVLLTDLVGLQVPAYRSQLSTPKTEAARQAAINWTLQSCDSLTRHPPPDLLQYIATRMAQTATAAAANKRNKGRGDSRGPPGMMDCAGYGPCEIPGYSEAQKLQYTWYDEAQCSAVTPQMVLQRMCGRMATDEPLYRIARARFDARVAVAGNPLVSRVRLLRDASAALRVRAEAQSRVPPKELAAAAGITLTRSYRMSSGGGVPWVIDEFAPWYKPYDRARYSCVNCSGDVVPEKDLVGCWPLWGQFAPDEMQFHCTRTWTSDPGENHPRDFSSGSSTTFPCWQTCWKVMASKGRNAAHCTAPCPAVGRAEPARAWRERWDRELATFMESETLGGQPAGLALTKATHFIRPLRDLSFMWHVY